MSTEGHSGVPAISGWYELFSRGSRDWLRHGEKVREAVRENLPQIVAGADIINHGAHTVRVPVRMLEHYRFRLRGAGQSTGVGQGAAKPGDVLGQPRNEGTPGQKGAGEESDWRREGWDRRGARSRLDRRRSMREAAKRRAFNTEAPALIDEDL